MVQYNLTSNDTGSLTDDTKTLLQNASENDSNLLSILKTNYNLNDADLNNIEGTLTSSKNYTNSALNNLSNITAASQVNLNAASNNLVNQMVVNDVINTEIGNTQAEYNNLLQNNTNQRRLVENNTYYTQRYEAHTELMKTIIIICIPLLLITLLGNKGLLPGNLAYWLGGIGLLIGLGIVGVKVFDLYYRDNFNFNEYTQPFYSVESQKETDAGKNYGILSELEQDFSQYGKNLEANLDTCFGSSCCGQGLQYVASKRLCEIKPIAASV
jgi:hypothetical protein